MLLVTESYVNTIYLPLLIWIPPILLFTLSSSQPHLSGCGWPLGFSVGGHPVPAEQALADPEPCLKEEPKALTFSFREGYRSGYI